MQLMEKIEESLSIVEYAVETYGEGLFATFSGGKDSLVMLHLLQTVGHGRVNVPVLSIDTTVKFPETMAFRDALATDWGLDLRIIGNPEAALNIDIAADRAECCQALKVGPLNRAIVDLDITGLMSAIRWDEHPARASEEPISPRIDPPHDRIHPILHFTVDDIWDYIHAFNLPYCSLYDEGYASLSCVHCTVKSGDQARERAGRAPEKEEIMEQLRHLGYF
ncbi:phosphoadenosine phosphosulfate reductase family protein [Desulfovibrio inopinatus]|uniref:phosphoadenosine phosphosulfate reductase family protein n=1 Tax=Desulfovibrio inopinatus TaxID=102109 RepID=UPI0003F97801|nr:phosphoadenosine phosphosulfate reductase family protein [Desulfovibrio inopinatus]